MNLAAIKTPGVYINELPAFPNSVVPVATAIPAFIGTTPRASYQGRDLTSQAVKISSFTEYCSVYAALDGAGNSLPSAAQYAPRYRLARAPNPKTADIMLGGVAFVLEADNSTISYFYNSIRLFFQNGGSTCYVLSLGDGGKPAGKFGGDRLNPNLHLADFLSALRTLEKVPDATLVVIPDATLLSLADHGALNQAVLAHCARMQSRLGLFDVRGAAAPDATAWMGDITAFRTGVGNDFLNYGVAYYPFLCATVAQDADVDYRNLGGGAALAAVLPGSSREPLKTLLAQADAPPGPNIPPPAQIEAALRTASPDYAQLHTLLLARVNTLPPTPALAGIYAFSDNTSGVWTAPANCPIASVDDVTVKLTETMQGPLNVDPVTGKSINAIRVFPAMGLRVWGARTLDGNSDDWRYVNVRRTVIFIEQSLKLALQQFVFAPNNANTWSTIQSMFTAFLTQQWQAGALQGAKPDAAFAVSVGLGVTMTAQDILDGLLRGNVRLAVSHPAEFIVLTFEQQLSREA